MAGETWEQVYKVAGHIAPSERKWRERDAGSQPNFSSFPFLWSRIPCPGYGAPHIQGGGLCLSAKLLGKHSELWHLDSSKSSQMTAKTDHPLLWWFEWK